MSSAPHLRECADCGTVNNLCVNPDNCWKCGSEWGHAHTFNGP